MMTVHLCESPKKLSWSQIKQSILGRQRHADIYICGGCSRTFETICCLHFHCMKHNEGGSYYFDHVTNTAFPKFDLRCSATQFEAEDLNNVNAYQKVLIGHPRAINLTENNIASLDVETNDTDTEQHAFLESEPFKDDDKAADNEKTRYQNAKSRKRTVQDGTEEGTNAGKSRKERELQDFAVVKVRNIEKQDDGSITFEMNEEDEHLFQVTANTIVDQLKKNGGDLHQIDQEFEVMVPNGLNSTKDIKAEEAITNVDSHFTSKSNSVLEPCSSVSGNSKLGKDHSERYENSNETPDLENTKIAPLGLESQSKPEYARCDNDVEKDDDHSEKSVDTVTAYTVTAYKEDTNQHNFDEIKRNLRSFLKKKKELFNDNLDKESLEQADLKTSESEVEVIDDKQKAEVIPVYTRSARKRKLTTKMRESELPDILKVTERQPGRKRKFGNNQSGSKVISSEKDFNASETLLSLRETGKSKQLRCSLSEYVDFVVPYVTENEGRDMYPTDDANKMSTKDKDRGLNAKKKRDMDIDKIIENKNIEIEESDSTDLSDIMIKTEKLTEQVEKDENEKNEENETGSFDFDENTDDIPFEPDEEENPKKKYFPKKQRQKRSKSGKIPVYKRTDFKCEVCGKVGTINMIKYHEQMHSDNMPFKCDECGKRFKTAACKRSHALQHGERRWKCDQCPAAFFRKQYLDVHLTNHTGEYPYVCELCGMRFKMAYIVRRHVNNVHKNIRNYKCDICEKKFFRVATRDLHRMRHFEPSLQCSYCPKKFKGDLDLRKHELTHTGEKMYFCPVCNQGFTQIWPYYKHMWRLHNIEKEEAKRIRIKNPDIVNMRNINKDAVNKETAYVHEFIGKPGCTFDMRKSFSQNVKRLRKVDHETASHCEDFGEPREIGVSSDANRVYTETNSDVTDTIVVDIGEDLDARETIVIKAEDFPNVDNQQTGYIVVDNGHDGNIVIYSELAQNEIENVKEYSAVDI